MILASHYNGLMDLATQGDASYICMHFESGWVIRSIMLTYGVSKGFGNRQTTGPQPDPPPVDAEMRWRGSHAPTLALLTVTHSAGVEGERSTRRIPLCSRGKLPGSVKVLAICMTERGYRKVLRLSSAQLAASAHTSTSTIGRFHA